jgi:HSP20 family molecular chaperone IbpA
MSKLVLKGFGELGAPIESYNAYCVSLNSDNLNMSGSSSSWTSGCTITTTGLPPYTCYSYPDYPIYDWNYPWNYSSELYKAYEKLIDLIKELNLGGKTKLPVEFVSNSYPPANIYINQGNMVYEFAIAGYEEKEVELTFEDDYLVLKLKKEEDTEEKDKKYLQKGIKRALSNESKYYIAVAKYDIRSSKAFFDKGILKVVVPAREEAKPFSIPISR